MTWHDETGKHVLDIPIVHNLYIGGIFSGKVEMILLVNYFVSMASGPLKKEVHCRHYGISMLILRCYWSGHFEDVAGRPIDNMWGCGISKDTQLISFWRHFPA